jgi:hypothetical protein
MQVCNCRCTVFANTCYDVVSCCIALQRTELVSVTQVEANHSCHDHGQAYQLVLVV